MKLTLCSLYKDPYSESLACAYIYYGTAEDPRDQDNNKIDNFMSDTQRDALKKHLEDDILPQFKNFSTQYEITIVDYVNNAPHPVIFIARKDNHSLQNTDMNAIQNAINAKINLLSNKKVPSFFHKQHSAKLEQSYTQTRYDLRPR